MVYRVTKALGKDIFQTGTGGGITLLLVSLLLGWILFIFNKSFVPTNIIVISCLMATIFFMVLFFAVWNRIASTWIMIFLSIYYGCTIALSLLIVVNHYTTTEKTITVSVEPCSRYQQWARRSDCWSYDAVVELEGVKRRIRIGCGYKNEVYAIKTVKMVLSKGGWGFPVIRGMEISK